METLARKTFNNAADAIAAQRAESFIAGQSAGPFTWPDESQVHIDSIVKNAVLRITDKIGDDRGSLRHIELCRGNRVLVTLVYAHFTKELIRTY